MEPPPPPSKHQSSQPGPKGGKSSGGDPPSRPDAQGTAAAGIASAAFTAQGKSAASCMPWMIFLSGGQKVASAPLSSALSPRTK